MKKLLALLLALAMVLSLAACGGSEAPAADAPAADAPAADAPAADAEKTPDPITIKLSQTASMEEHHGICYETLKAYIEEKCPWITVEIYYSSTLYDDSTGLDAVSRGNCEMVVTAPGYLGEIAPQAAIFGACYIFENADQMLEILNGEIGMGIYEDIAAETGLRPLGALYKGRRSINLTIDKEIKSRADMEGILMRVPNADSWMQMGYALGCTPTPMALGEVYLGLQAGTIQGQDNPLQATMSYGFGEVTKSITMTNHVIDLNWLVISEDLWQTFDAETQEVFYTAFQMAAQESYDAYMGEETELIAQFREMGLSVYEPDMSQMKEEVWEYYWSKPAVSGGWDKDVYEAIQNAA